ncbi:RsiV family protein [Bacillus sp. FJAT-44742]|uniref:RsiV family protein n=1 Tax=Bacillus sp. FJAT-44742 TaxID=2014005 RepID=UPI000C238B29|nr:RsiV family protein [Bacillus sp. FJAT-44742]
MNSFPVPPIVVTVSWNFPLSVVYFPQLFGVPSFFTQQTMNRKITSKVAELLQSFAELGYLHWGKTSVNGYFEIKNVQRNVLSLTLGSEAMMPGMAHPASAFSSLTFDLQTGEEYELKDLFLPGSPYTERLSLLVNEQIEELQIPVFETPVTVSENQDFYIADKSLVIFFQRYSISPGYAGYPMFPIPIYKLDDIINKEGPLARMRG